MVFLGAVIAAFVLMPFVSGDASQLFNVCFVAIAGTSLVLAAMLLKTAESREQATGKGGGGGGGLKELLTMKKKANAGAGDQQEKEKKEKAVDKTTQKAKKALGILMIGSALDSAGDEGNSVALYSVMTSLYPTTNNVAFMNNTTFVIIAAAILATALVGQARKLGGLGWPLVLGAFATLVGQLAYVPCFRVESTPYVFLGTWFVARTFGMMSDMSVALVINKLAADDSKGYWLGKNMAYSSALKAVVPMTVAAVYDYVNIDGDKNRGTAAILLTCFISLSAFVAYLPMINAVPKDDDKALEAELEAKLEDMARYEAMDDKEWSRLEITEQVAVIKRRIKEGKEMRFVKWGQYTDDRPDLPELVERAGRDFAFVRAIQKKILASREMLEQSKNESAITQKMMVAKIDMAQARSEMGKWLADYMDDAGYEMWSAYPAIFKAMFVTAFPPVAPIDDLKNDYESMSVEDYEAQLLATLKVFNAHLKATERQRNEKRAQMMMGKALIQSLFGNRRGHGGSKKAGSGGGGGNDDDANPGLRRRSRRRSNADQAFLDNM